MSIHSSLYGRIVLWIGLCKAEPTKSDGNATGFRWTDGTWLNNTYDIWYASAEGRKTEPMWGDQHGRLFRSNGTAPIKWAAAPQNDNIKKGYICKKG